MAVKRKSSYLRTRAPRKRARRFKSRVNRVSRVNVTKKGSLQKSRPKGWYRTPPTDQDLQVPFNLPTVASVNNPNVIGDTTSSSGIDTFSIFAKEAVNSLQIAALFRSIKVNGIKLKVTKEWSNAQSLFANSGAAPRMYIYRLVNYNTTAPADEVSFKALGCKAIYFNKKTHVNCTFASQMYNILIDANSPASQVYSPATVPFMEMASGATALVGRIAVGVFDMPQISPANPSTVPPTPAVYHTCRVDKSVFFQCRGMKGHVIPPP